MDEFTHLDAAVEGDRSAYDELVLLRQRLAELEAEEESKQYKRTLADTVMERDTLKADNERLRRPACGTEENWLALIRSDDEQALSWFRAMLRESDLKKQAMVENERLRKENEAAIFVLQEIAELSPEVGATWAAKFAESHLQFVKCDPSS